MTTPFNPVVGPVELPLLRGPGVVPRPKPGYAVVLQPGKGELRVVRADERVPLFERYRSYYMVDLNARALTTSAEGLPCSKPEFTFSADVDFVCQVLDPALAVEHDYHDVAAMVGHRLRGLLVEIARRFDVTELGLFAEAAQAAVRNAHSTDVGGLALSGYSVRPRRPDDYYDTVRDTRMEKVRRTAMREVVDGGREEMVAQYLAKHDGDPAPLFAAEAESTHRDKDRALDGLRITTSAEIDPVEGRRLRGQLFGEVLRDRGVDTPTEVRGSRRARLSERRAPIEIEGISAPAGDGRARAEDGETPGGGKAPRSPRLRGTSSTWSSGVEPCPGAEEPPRSGNGGVPEEPGDRGERAVVGEPAPERERTTGPQQQRASRLRGTALRREGKD